MNLIMDFEQPDAATMTAREIYGRTLAELGKHNDKIVGLTADLAKTTAIVHFEKAYSELQGAYPLINREFARWIREHCPQVRWLNREDDMGLEGLRRSKESYHPDRMVVKCSAVHCDPDGAQVG